jgi:hypothetical protein
MNMNVKGINSHFMPSLYAKRNRRYDDVYHANRLRYANDKMNNNNKMPRITLNENNVMRKQPLHPSQTSIFSNGSRSGGNPLYITFPRAFNLAFTLVIHTRLVNALVR